MTRHLYHWGVLANRAMVGVTVGISQSSQRDMPTDFKPGHSKIRQNLLAVAYQAKSLGISWCDGRDMPTVAPAIVQMAKVSELEASCSKIHRIQRTSFCINGCVTL
jgi:hypothetical protein